MLASLVHGNGQEDKIPPNLNTVLLNQMIRIARRERNSLPAAGEGVLSKGSCVVQEPGKKRWKQRPVWLRMGSWCGTSSAPWHEKRGWVLRRTQESPILARSLYSSGKQRSVQGGCITLSLCQGWSPRLAHKPLYLWRPGHQGVLPPWYTRMQEPEDGGCHERLASRHNMAVTQTHNSCCCSCKTRS